MTVLAALAATPLPLIRLLGHPPFARCWLAGLVSGIGDWVLFLGVPYAVYARTGSTAWTGAVFIAGVVPRLFGSVAGIAADRWDRRRLMIGCDLSQAALLLLLLPAAATDALGLIVAGFFALTAISWVFQPAKSALIPALVKADQLTAANALDSVGMGLARLVGPLLGGLVLAAWGLAGVFLVDAASFLLSAALLAGMTTSTRIPAPAPAGASPAAATWLRDTWAAWWEGLRAIRATPAAAVILVTAGLVMVAYGLIMVLLVVFVGAVLGGGALELGWLATLQGAGVLAGTLLVGAFGGRLTPVRLYAGGLLACGAGFLLAFTATRLEIAAVGVTLAGLAMASWMVAERTLLQVTVVDAVRGRTFGTAATTNGLLLLAGTALASGLGDRSGPTPPLIGAALLYWLAGGLAAVALPRIGSIGSPNFGWLIEGRLAGSSRPHTADALTALRAAGIRALVSLSEAPVPGELLARLDLLAVYIPVADFTALSLVQIERAVAAIEGFLADGRAVAVHCGAGLGRTGTVLACYLVRQGSSAAEAMATVRTRRPGSIETPEQEAVVAEYEQHLAES